MHSFSSLQQIRQELQVLRSVVIGIVGKDAEGEYRPEFVQNILRAAKEKPRHIYRGSKYFLLIIH